jgi:hypothetical protein
LRGYFIVTGGTVLAGLLAFLAGTADGAAQPKRAGFQVTLNATVAKDWTSVTESNENGCPTSQRSVGRRTVTLRSARPTTVIVTLGNGRVSFSPAVVQYVRAELSQSGNRTMSVRAPCKVRMAHSRCTHARRAVSGARFGFFRSARNELSFRSARLPEFSMACPPESSGVRGIRPGLQEAQGEISEAVLMDPRIPTQTAVGTAEVTTDLQGQETGQVVEHVSWGLTFTRKR